jgi:hypothetical protein
VAEWLIVWGGVLVPSAMINQDCADLFFESDGRPPAREIRARLERIARGEEAQPARAPWPAAEAGVVRAPSKDTP